MVRFTFASGKEQDFDYDWQMLAPKLQLAGLRLFKPEAGVLIPLNSNTISLIEEIVVEDEDGEEIATLTMETEAEIVDELDDDEPVETVEVKTEPKKLSIEEKKELILKDMKEKSECVHEKKDIYYQEVMAGPRGHQKIQKRYFPVCAKCGVRERYVKADSLSPDEKLEAKLWDK